MLLTQKNMWETVLGLVKRDGEAQRRVDALETKHRVLQCRVNTLTQDSEADTIRIASLEREVKALKRRLDPNVPERPPVRGAIPTLSQEVTDG